MCMIFDPWFSNLIIYISLSVYRLYFCKTILMSYIIYFSNHNNVRYDTILLSSTSIISISSVLLCNTLLLHGKLTLHSINNNANIILKHTPAKLKNKTTIPEIFVSMLQHVVDTTSLGKLNRLITFYHFLSKRKIQIT